MEESEEELERLLMKVKVESEKVGLKLNIQIMKIMASVPISSGSSGKESACNVGDLGLIPGLGRSPRGHGNPL